MVRILILNELEEANWDIYGDFKLKKALYSPWFKQS